MIRIVHISDWHGQIYKLPKADLYVATGDMYCNYVRYLNTKLSNNKNDHSKFTVDNAYDAAQQEKFAKKYGAQQMREAIGSDAPVVCVRGNHCYADAWHLFAKCNLVHEFLNNEVIEVAGLKVTGHRGCPPINGTWSDEMSNADLMDRVRAMDPSCDLYLTHYPSDGSGLGKRWGFQGMSNWFDYQCQTEYPLHLAGHVHEGYGWSKLGRVFSSNASEWFNVIEGSPSTGWKIVDQVL